MVAERSLLWRVDAVTRRPWFVVVLVVVLLVVGVVTGRAGSNDADEVTRRLEQTYGVREVVWRDDGRFGRDTLVVDGRDVSDDCRVTGAWGSLDDVAIECDGDSGFAPVEGAGG